jgi:hypothetical protein
MPNFTFRKDDVQVFAVYSNNAYNILTSEISFGQTFQESSFEVKTIQSQGSFEGSVINKANAAEFSLNVPLLEEATNTVLFDRLVDAAAFDLYISSQHDVWKLEKCVIQDGTFEINQSRPLRLAISGEASKLSKYTPTVNVALNAVSGKRIQIKTVGNTDWISIGAPNSKVGTIFTAISNGSGNGTAYTAHPGTLQNAGVTTTTYIVPRLNLLTIGGTNISSNVVGVSAELQNDINWRSYNTVHGALSATNAATSQYPETFHIGTRVLGGSITKYLSDTSQSALTWESNTSLKLKATNSAGSKGLELDITNCSFTNRISSGTIYTEEYNWRMTQNPTALSSVLKLIT